MARVFGSLKIRKDGANIGSYRSSNSIFSLSTVLISSLKMSIESFTFLEDNPFRKTLLLDMIQIFDSLKKIPKCVNNSESYRFSIFFSVFTASIPSVNVSIVNSEFVEKYFNEKLLLLFRGLDFCLSEGSKGCQQYWFISIFKLQFFTNYSFDFFPQDLNQNVYFFRREYVSKNFDSTT